MDDPISDLFAMHRPEADPEKKSKISFISKKSSIVALVLIVVLVAFVGGFLTGNNYGYENARIAFTEDASTATAPASTTSKTADEADSAQLLELDPKKDYGDKYSDGILPVGDKKYVTDKAKKGSVFLCKVTFVPESQAGAQTRGPWFVNNNTEWDLNKKPSVGGNIDWENSISNKIEGDNRIIKTNGLPDHHTGTFPVAATDDAHEYDPNPNTIQEQDLTYTLTATPEAGDPQCMGGESGILTTGAALFNAFDAGGRDAGAWEVQDTCDGHPQDKGLYHYHTLSRCIKDIDVSTVIGFALDGIPITGPRVSDGNFLTTNDLDECHGIVSEINLDDKKTKMYHYVMTQDFPYSVSCFRAKPITAPGANSSGAETETKPSATPTPPKPSASPSP
jgi:hypothetical protein